MLDIVELASWRKGMAKVDTWDGISSGLGWFSFYPTSTGIGHLARQWLSCMCTSCKMHKGEYDPTLCLSTSLLTTMQKDYNEPQVRYLKSKQASEKTKTDELKASAAVLYCNI